jgi:hypothetical protein
VSWHRSSNIRNSKAKGDSQVKLFKMLGLAAVAALAVMAFIGTSTAAADSACLKDETPCASPYTGSIFGLSTEAVLTAGVFKVTCTESAVLGDFVKNEGAHTGVTYLMLSVTFKKCGGSCKKVKGEATLNPPYNALASADKGTLAVTEDGKGAPKALLEGCSVLGFTVACEYEAEPTTTLKYDLSGPAFKAEGVTLLRAGDSSLCPKEGSWTAKYLLEEDPGGQPLYLVSLP